MTLAEIALAYAVLLILLLRFGRLLRDVDKDLRSLTRTSARAGHKSLSQRHA